MSRFVCRYSCRKFVQHWKALTQWMLGIAFIVWLVWNYQRSLIHATKFLINADYRECVHRRRTYEIEEQSSPLYVTLARHGRLGNWLYGYASLLGIAKANGYIPYLSSMHPLTSYFALTKTQDKPAECLYTVYDDLPCTYNSQFMNLPAGNISIDGYIQSWKYFRSVEDEIRKEFRMHEYLRVSAYNDFVKYMDKYLKENRLVISIHVRRGDVLRPEARKLGFRDAPVAYFENAMKYMLREHPYAVFFVTSDEIEWCKENIIPPTVSEVFDGAKTLQQISKEMNLPDTLTDKVPIIFSSSSSQWKDFAMLTLCNHSIISVGTFGWWSAWLANGDVVYFKDTPIPGTKVYYETKKEDFFPSHWVALSTGISIVRLSNYWVVTTILCLFMYFSSLKVSTFLLFY